MQAVPFSPLLWETMKAISPTQTWGTLTLGVGDLGFCFRYIAAYALADGKLQDAPVLELVQAIAEVIAHALDGAVPSDHANFTLDTSPWKREGIKLSKLQPLRTAEFW